MAPIMIRLTAWKIPYNFIFTGQHQDTIEEMIKDFGVKQPDKVLYKGSDITSVSAMFFWALRIIWASLIQKSYIFGGDREGIVLVHGDTFSTLLGALMGKLAHLKIGHIESGLRSYNLFHPFPEEITRILIFHFSHVLFCPGDWAMRNVINFKREKINTLENTLYDSLISTSKYPDRVDHVPDYPFVIISLHRYENIFKKSKFQEILHIIDWIADYYKIIFILHPSTEKQLCRFGLYEKLNGNKFISLRPRYNHSDFISLLRKCEFVVTDGGSLQEETYYLGIPCLLLRKVTERKEGIGKNVVLSNYDEQVVKEFSQKYLQYKFEPIILEDSPSDLIVRKIRKYSSDSISLTQ